MSTIRTRAVSAVSGALTVLLATASIANAQTVGPSAIVCDSFARDYAQKASAKGQIIGRVAGGSLLGLGIGAIAGASGVGAAVGAGVGLIAGGARRQADAQRIYAAAYHDCMAGYIR